jgi:hypothetical protein
MSKVHFWKTLFVALALSLLLSSGLFVQSVAAFGWEDSWGVSQWGSHSYNFYVHTSYGAHYIHVNNNQGGYNTGSFFCNANDCYTSWPVYSSGGEYVYDVTIYGDNWADIYGWGGY